LDFQEGQALIGDINGGFRGQFDDHQGLLPIRTGGGTALSYRLGGVCYRVIG
jgi:hypothetical protein